MASKPLVLVILCLTNVVLVKSDPTPPGLDYRDVSYENLLDLKQFFDTGVGNFSQLLFDSQHHQLIAGARDAIYRLTLDSLHKLEKVEWPATKHQIDSCTLKGQSEADCHNFIKILVSYRDKLFACGTNAFSPQCSWRDIEALKHVTRTVEGRGKCPYSPKANSSAFMNDVGDFYIASSTDPSGIDHAIYRMSGAKLDENLMKNPQYDSLWLNQPNFVLTFETDQFVYFVFRENAMEYMNCGKTIYSRIARVCKNDQGGQYGQKDQWTTFLKARLNCSIAGDYPFYYDEIQSAYYEKSEGIVYATFTTPENSIAGSAVCSFDLKTIEDTFKGPFKKQNNRDSIWQAVDDDVDHSHFECQRSTDRDYRTPNSREYQLLNQAVPSTPQGPVYKEHLERFTHIVVDSVLTKIQSNDPVHVIFIATRSGTIKKLSYNPRSQQTCVVEILHPFAEGRSVNIHSMKLLSNAKAIYMATDENVLRLPVSRCQRFRKQRECLNAMDPYCGWNQQINECVATPNNNPRAGYWQQSLLSCPIMSDPVDGQWGKWSLWSQCGYSNPDTRIDSNGDYCQCRQRKCDSPAVANGGQDCAGQPLEVTNCTQHGGWTEWSDWSACSLTCDGGNKQRRRTCGNPTPAFGGRVCVGRDVETKYCDDSPSCSAGVVSSASLVRETPTFQRLWGQWGGWSECSVECGRGFRTRSRKCFNSRGNCEGGCATQYEKCENKQCSNLVEVTDWTPWLKSNESSVGGAWYEERFRFSYKSSVSLDNQIGQIHKEERYCRGTNNCNPYTSMQGSRPEPDVWSDWSKCTRECGGGYQIKTRTCTNTNSNSCVGGSVLQRACNTQPCKGEWGCWSSWSVCDGRTFKKHRSRVCQSINGIVSGDRASSLCSTGTDYDEIPCDGWGPWASWSQCDLATDSRTRSRVCLNSHCDEGHDFERQTCDGLHTSPVSSGSSSDLVAVACICSFIVGAGFGAGIVIYFVKFRRPGSNGSPHYVSAKSQNLYVSLPMLDLKHKHLSSNQSDCGTLRSTSTLRSKANSSVYNASRSEYETATIKRSHSQSHRNSSLIAGSSTLMRADLDSDQLFT